MLHGLLPLSLSLLAASPSPLGPTDASPADADAAATEKHGTAARVPRLRELRVDIQKDWIRGALAEELRRESFLDDFQVVTSKFHDGRVVLTDFRIAPGPRRGTAHLTAFGDLRFRRRQLGMKWRGFKSHKKWFDKGEKHVATARVSGVVALSAMRDRAGIRVTLKDLRVKVTGHLRPARGVVARFDLKDRTHVWAPKDHTWVDRLLKYAFELQSVRISRVTRSTIEVTVCGMTPQARKPGE